MTLLFVDTETTGIDRIKDSIIQISGIIMNETEEETFDFRMAPYKSNDMDAGAEEKTGYTNEMIRTWPDQAYEFTKFINILDKYINRYDWNSRAFIVGWNVGFDTDFIRGWFNFNNNNNFGRYFYSPNLDLMSYVGFHMAQNRKELKNFKLETVYEALMNRPMEGAHNAMSDIIATKQIFDKTCSYLVGFKEFIRPIEIKKKRRLLNAIPH